jgi:uncharacterized protein YndB with AHSA1/START domain
MASGQNQVSHIQSVTATEEFDTPAAAVWTLLTDWGGIVDWMPDGYIRSLRLDGRGIGAIRHLVTGKGVQISERLVGLDEKAGTLELAMVDTLPWGLLSYRASAGLVRISDNRCRLTWTGTFETADGGPRSNRIAMLLEKSYAKMFLGIRHETA